MEEHDPKARDQASRWRAVRAKAKMIKNKNLTFRARGDMRDRLARAASKNDRSLSEEIENRLEMSFHYERQIQLLIDRNKEADAERRDLIALFTKEADAERRDLKPLFTASRPNRQLDGEALRAALREILEVDEAKAGAKAKTEED